MTKYMIRRKWEIQKLLILIQLILLPILGTIIIAQRDWNTLLPSRVCTVSMDIMGMLILIILFFSCVKDRNDLAFRSGLFTYMISLTGWALFFDLIAWCVDEIPSLRLFNILSNEGYYLVGVAMVMLFWHYLVEVSDLEDPNLEKMTKVLNAVGALTFAATLGNLLGGYYFYVDAAGVYHRSKYHLSSQFFILFMMICLVSLIIRMKMTKVKRRALLSFVALPFLATAFQAFVYGLSVIYIGVLGALIIIYGNVFAEQNRELAEQKLENAQKEREILLAKQEHQRLETELSLASDIQTHVIPMIFPPFPERKEFQLFASMDPAKEVGGDFYDFFLVDHDHLALVIADVSGKGIPAALYMMIAKTMIKNTASSCLSPSKILEAVNHQLCENSEEVEMFVTVWLGIIDLTNGKMVAANGGHEYPAICRKGGRFELFKDKHGLVLGGMDGMRYKEYELDFEEGDTIFVYTDGVTEAVDPDNNLFGIQNMLETLNRAPQQSTEDILHSMRAEIEDFASGADQFDDITMMAFRFSPRED